MRYDPQRWLLSGPRGRVRLSPHQAVALELLTAQPGRRVDRDVLWHALYRHRRDDPPDPKALDVMMHRLRRQLRAAGVDDAAIATVWGGGWVWEGGPLEKGNLQ